jgi:hypothetical protein
VFTAKGKEKKEFKLALGGRRVTNVSNTIRMGGDDWVAAPTTDYRDLPRVDATLERRYDG